MVSSLRIIVLVAIASCDATAPASTPDARPEDAGSVLDALTCSLPPPVVLRKTDGNVEVLFDVGLPSFWQDDGSAHTLIVRSSDVLVFTRRAVHRIALSGTLVSSAAYDVSAPGSVSVLAVQPVADEFAAIVETISGSVFRTSYCRLSSEGGYSLDRCALLADELVEIPSLHIHDGLSSVWVPRPTGTYRWRLDDVPTIVDEDVVVPPGIDLRILSLNSDGEDELVTTGAVRMPPGRCTTLLQHRVTNDSYSTNELLTEDAAFGYGTIARSPGSEAIVYNAGCILEEGCAVSEPHTVMVARAATGFADASPIGVPHDTPVALDVDGNRVVVSYRIGVERVVASRFEADSGQPDIAEVTLPLPGALGNEVSNVRVLRTIADDDYLLAYAVEHRALGHQGRVARIRIPSSP